MRGLDRTGILLLLLLATDEVVDAKDTAEGGLKNTPVMYVMYLQIDIFYTIKIASMVGLLNDKLLCAIIKFYLYFEVALTSKCNGNWQRLV